MPKLVFYRQKRYDDAIRTGIELDDQTIAHRFEDVEGDRDPALLWYVDLRCSGPGIPDSPDAAAHWLVEHSEIIREGFERFAQKLSVGADTDDYSLTWDDFPKKPDGVEMKIACSAVRRIDARQMAQMLSDIGRRWDQLIDELEIIQEAEDLR
jgi:hypothetical protein